MKLPNIEKRENVKEWAEFFAAICIAFLWLIIVWKTLGIYFETNDDKFMAEILSGVITGKPDAHTVYLNYLLAALLAFLYRIIPGIPWYGGMLVSLHLLTYAMLLRSAWSQKRTALRYMIITGVIGCCALTNLYITVNVQYTSTAVFLAAGGYTCLILHKNPRKGVTLFVLLELLAFLVRDQAMLMIQPLGASVWMGLNLIYKNTGMWEKTKRTGGIFLIICVIVLIGKAGNLYGYQGEEWKRYSRFNDARTILFDYCGKPEYEEVKRILDGYGVSEAEYVAFCNGVMMDWDISVECVEEIAAYAEQKAQKNIDINSILKQIWGMDKSLDVSKKQVWAVTWWALLLWMLLLGRFYLAVPLGGMAAGRTFVWGYLIYRGRMPARVTNPLISSEILLLTALLIWDYTVGIKGLEIRKALVALLCAVCGFFCVLTGWKQYYEVREIKDWQETYMNGLLEIQFYCNEHPEDRYLLDAWSFSYYTGSAFETRIYRKSNCVYSGGWFTNTPLRHQYMQEYFEGHENDLYLIVYDDGNREGYFAVKYLAEKFDTPPVLTDQITVSHGGIYLVWHFSTNGDISITRCY